jgi:hypothetical protein
MATVHRLLILLAVVALALGVVEDYVGFQVLPIGAPLTWLRISGLLLLFALAIMLDELITRLSVKR